MHFNIEKLRKLNKFDLQNKTILYRSPYDIGTELKNGKYVVKDDSRIRATLPTLKNLLDQNCKIVILTWVERPTPPERKEEFKTKPHAEKLAELLEHPVIYIDDCIGEKVENTIKSMKPKDILMLENTRFYNEEFDDDDNFAKKLTIGSDFIVFDGFPQAHRKHASTTGILRHLPSCAGLYLQKEVEALSEIITSPKKPFTLVIGGAKVSDKVDAVRNLLNQCDAVLLGGGAANVFLKAQGTEMGKSYIEEKTKSVDETNEGEDVVEIAEKILQDHQTDVDRNFFNYDDITKKIMTPIDVIAGKSLEDDSDTLIINLLNNTIPNDLGAFDIGPTTTDLYSRVLSCSKTIFWAGPMGVYEKQNYSEGTNKIAKAITDNKSANKIAAGGDTIDAIDMFSAQYKFNHISLAGGASLDFLARKDLPVLEMLVDNNI